ncbi:3-hydroxyacyl-ACP dehydratase FabZ family protein [Tautonia plasticadhaerens]|uniref:3-hydroxyacyl-[acyl-carrier-protein] dehydratase FabZ n=1 Tax=Tautonia plasticadhaerens TaxID=2527974 RepID=A0A518GXF5_9BACT|nr:3-hydroxyacyl-ACP dehydratase FabZ family protein [Tautonia plasticadhaerens]QDV33267.1 3-hydroxyacyl-[acyl-carrier-protein] dehydratase FabZ [Tautonia plasticadhaerens]
MPPVAIIPPSEIDLERIVADQEQIRRFNPQRFEMEQLSAIVHVDTDEHLIVGYKDLDENEFWTRGHIPGYPLMPGVLICEVAAQLCSYYCQAVRLVPDGFLGFGGLEDVRFRGPVRPGDRLVIVGKAQRLHRRQTVFDTQGFVDRSMVYHGRIIGVPIVAPGRVAAGGREDG